MSGRRHLSLLVLSALTMLTISGCRRGFTGGTATVRIPHPGSVQLVAQRTIIQSRDERAERRQGMGPNTLVDSAALTRMDDGGICVQMALWATHDNLHRGDYALYGFELEASAGPAVPPRTVSAAAVTPAGQWDQNHIGQRWRQVPNGLRDQCVNRDMDGYCQSYQTRVTTQAVREQATVGVRYYAADICFGNRGLVNMNTRSLTLVVRHRRRAGGRLGRRARRYVWEFDNAAQQYRADAQSTLVVGPNPGAAPMGPGAPPATAGGQVTLNPSMPAGGGSLSVMTLPYPVEQVPGGHPVDDARMRQLMDARFGGLRLCLEGVAEQAPNAFLNHARMVAEFTIGPSGVANVRVTENTFPPAAATCMEQYLGQLPIPADPMRWTAMYRYGVENRVRAAAGAI